MNIKSVKGMNDVIPPEVDGWRYIETQIRTQLEDYGYAEIKTPIVEMTQLFTRSVGDTTDIVSKEMYTFLDRNEESLTLRPEGTAPVVRALVEHNLLNQDPVQKFYYWGPMFRYERPQKGRYRQFYQYGVEVFGIASAQIDAEVIAMLAELYTKLGLKELSVKIGSLGCSNCRPLYREKLVKLLRPSAHILCGECQTRLEKNPLRIFDCKNPTCKEVASVLPGMLDHLCSDCNAHFNQLRDYLVLLKAPFVVDGTLVRGFDYYTRTVFEITTENLGAQNAVCGGGRYDALVEELGGPSCPAFGFAGGVERLMLLLGDKAEWHTHPKIFFVTPDEKGLPVAFRAMATLRAQGVRAEMDYTGKSMKSQMKRADKLGAEFVCIIGGSEIEQGHGILRDMKTKNQENVTLSNFEEELLKRVGPIGARTKGD